MVFHAAPYPREKDTITDCAFTTKGVLYAMNAVKYNPHFTCYPNFTLSTLLMFNGSTSSRYFN